MTKQDEARTITQLIEWADGYLRGIGIDSPRLLGELLLAHVLKCERIQLLCSSAKIPAEQQRATFAELVRQAGEHCPVAYLIGKKEFYSLEFETTSAALIPRPETELLVEKVIDYCRSLGRRHIDILDLGTGSGCIGLALCRHLKQVKVVGSDISEAALDLAARNSERLAVQGRFLPVRADCLDLPPTAKPAEGFDLLVSNPPYVAASRPDMLGPEVRKYEPHLALFGGADGLDFYRTIAATAADILSLPASIFLEIGYDQHDDVVDIVTAGCYHHVESWRDYNEGHWRVVRFDRLS